MARQVLPIVGAVVGGYFGGPQGAQIGFAIGSVVGNAVDPQRLAGPKIGEVAVQTAEEGAVCPLYAGTCAGPGNLIYKHLFDPVIVEEQQGKGGGPIIESERLYGTFAVRIGASLFDGPGVRNGITGLIRIWEDEKLVYDVSPTSVILEESAEYANGFTFYVGTETQLPDPDIEAIEGVGNVPAYRGRAYIVFNYKDLTDRRGSVPQFRFEVTVEPGASANAPTLVTDVRHYTGEPEDLTVAASDIGFSSTIDFVRVSPGGLYAAGSIKNDTIAGRFKIFKWDQDSETWNAVADPANYPNRGPAGMDWMQLPDGTLYLAIAMGSSSPDNLIVYRVDSGDVFTKLPDPGDPLPNIGYGVSWDSVGQRLAVGNGNTGNGVYVWDFVSDALVNRRTASTNPTIGICDNVEWMDGVGSRYLACSNDLGVIVIDATDMTVAAAIAGDCGKGVHWDYSNGYIFGVGETATTPLKVYDFDGSVIGSETLTFVANFDTQPSTAPSDSAIDDERSYLAVSVNGSNFPLVYSLRGALPPDPVKEANPPNTGASVLSADWTNASIATITPGTSPLPDVIEAIVKRVKQPATIVNTDQVSSEIVRGLVFGSQDYTATDAIRSLAQVYLFDVADYDEQLHLVPRGGAVSFSVTEDDLAEAPSDSFVRANAIEQPGKISLFFQNPTIYYQPSKVNPPFIGYENGAVNEVTIQVPVVLNEADEAPQLVDKMQKINEVDAQGEITRVVSDRYLSVVPGAVGALTERGITRRVRVTGVEEYDYRMKLKMRIDRQSAVTSNLTVTPTPAPDPPPPSLAGVTQFALLNIPGIIDGDDRLGVRMGVCGLPDTAWQGALIQVSNDGGATYTNLVTITRSCIMGSLTANLPEAPAEYTDYTNALSVLLIDDRDLNSVTQTQLLNENNGFAIVRSNYTAEILQGRDVVETSDRNWDITTLIRGRLDTSTAEHMAGARFVDLAGTEFVPLPSAYLGQSLKFRVVSIGTSPETAPVYDFVFEPAYSQREFAAEFLSLSRDGTNITGSWVPRHRFGTDINPIASVNFDGWRVNATDGTFSQEFDTINPSFSLDETLYTGDVTVNVYQLNRITGVGPALTGII